MRSLHPRPKRWLAGGAGLLTITIALLLARRETSPHATPSPTSPASPLAVATPPEAPRLSTPEMHGRRAGDFAAALKAAVQDAEQLNDDRGVFELGYRWVAVEPEAALDFVLALPFDHTLLLVALVDEWTRRAPAAAATWAARLPEGPRRERVLPSLAAVWAEGAPADALRFASDLPPGNAKNEALAAAVSGWARHDPPAVLAWAGQFLHGEQQEESFTQIVYAWGQRDPVAAAEWLRAMPDGAAWDSAVSALSGVLVERYPALALSLAGNISDPDRRVARLENIAHRWLARDRAAAEPALVQSGLPADLVSRLLR